MRKTPEDKDVWNAHGTISHSVRAFGTHVAAVVGGIPVRTYAKTGCHTRG